MLHLCINPQKTITAVIKRGHSSFSYSTNQNKSVRVHVVINFVTRHCLNSENFQRAAYRVVEVAVGRGAMRLLYQS